MKLDFLNEFEFFAGVPDSLLQPLCNYLMQKYGVSKQHVIAVNEGNAVALAAGYHLATGKVPVVYLQNSGIGNIVNPVASLMNEKVYAIPCVFIVGWRGEPGIHDEPQHIFQGEVTIKLLEDLGIRTFVVEKETSEAKVQNILDESRPLLSAGKQIAFVVKKGAIEYDSKVVYENRNKLLREEAIRCIAEVSDDDLVISTTGKTSRELFEIREQNKQTHEYDFLTVGSMGHSSSIALSIAMQKKERKVWVIDGDGAALMHMGSMALIGANAPGNLVHIIINNCSHESVGGLPTIGDKVDFVKIAAGCQYPNAVRVETLNDLKKALTFVKQGNALSLIEVKCAIGARGDLGRPTTAAVENKRNFMEHIANHEKQGHKF